MEKGLREISEKGFLGRGFGERKRGLEREKRGFWWWGWSEWWGGV